MIHRTAVTGSVLALTLMGTVAAAAHCQIPCGIYDDGLRTKLIAEHIGTIDKSMGKIEELSAAQQPDFNQLSRWVANKDQHADELVHIVTYYFMGQRLKPSDLADPEKKDRYLEQLTLLHGMMFHAMKAKQTTDHQHVERLRELLGRFEVSYFGHAVEH
jgi:nickel superoxide dismutase